MFTSILLPKAGCQPCKGADKQEGFACFALHLSAWDMLSYALLLKVMVLRWLQNILKITVWPNADSLTNCGPHWQSVNTSCSSFIGQAMACSLSKRRP